MAAAEQRHEFQTETKQLLDLMIDSLYSHKEIFLRELISNASDALDKLRFEGLTHPELLPEEELHVFLEVDAKARTLTLRDNGIGMTRQEVIDNIGTIARSGTREFGELLRAKGGDLPSELIGQFGVGFYSSFLVAERVELCTRRAGEESATRWESSGEGDYVVADTERDGCGTTVTLHLRAVDDDDGIEDYTAPHVLRRIVRRYSDFVGYPIRMNVERKEPVLGADGKPLENAIPRVVTENQTLNSMKAIWTRDPEEISKDELEEFYKHVAHDWSAPLTHIHTRIEGSFEAQALLFVPSKAPFDLYHRDMLRRGIQLYVKRVFIMDDAKELLPDYLRFIKGVVDSEDLSLNVSREILQQDRQVKAIRKHLVKKVLDALVKLLADEREPYTSFWHEFGSALKEGLLDRADKSAERLLDLMLASSTHSDELTTLREYVERMTKDQDAIYFLTAPSLETAKSSPHLEAFRDKGIEVLFFVDGVDEVWLRSGWEFDGKRFQSIGQGEVELGSEEERKAATEAREEKQQTYGDLLQAMRAAVQDDIKEVRLSNRLTSSAACVVTDEGGITPQMEMMMRATGQELPKIKRILEVNPDHPVLTKLRAVHGADAKDERIAAYSQILLGQAILAEGGRLEAPAEFAKKVADLMARAL